MTKYGELVRESRTRLGMTQEQLARRSRVRRNYLSGIELGSVAPPSPRVSRKLERALKLNENRLVALSHAEKAPKQIKEFFIEAAEGKFAGEAVVA